MCSGAMEIWLWWKAIAQGISGGTLCGTALLLNLILNLPMCCGVLCGLSSSSSRVWGVYITVWGFNVQGNRTSNKLQYATLKKFLQATYRTPCTEPRSSPTSKSCTWPTRLSQECCQTTMALGSSSKRWTCRTITSRHAPSFYHPAVHGVSMKYMKLQGYQQLGIHVDFWSTFMNLHSGLPSHHGS